MLRDIWKNYHRYFKVSNKESNLAILFGIFGAFLETFSIYLLANIITSLGYKNTEFNVKFLELSNLNQEIFFIFIFSAILSAYLYYLSNKNIIKAKCIIERFIRQEITDLTLKIKWEYYIKISQGDISKSIISEGQNISEGYMYFLQFVTFSLIAFIYLLACLVFVPKTLLILIIYALFALRIYIYYSKKSDKYGKNLSQITSNIGKWTSGIFNNLKYLRSISKDQLAKDEAKKIFLKFSNSYENARVASYKSRFITELLTIIFISLSITFIILTKGNTSNLILSLSLFIRMTPKVYNSQSRLLDALSMVSWPRLHHEKIYWTKNFINNQNTNMESFEFNGKIIFKSVFFNYPYSKKILNKINLEIDQGECIGIIGESGSGKSTILDLITGIIKPKKGDIFLSGENISNININSWRKNIGIVMQENFFKNDSILNNIALGNKADKNKIKKALIEANAWTFVNKLPNGINEQIFDRGVRFSGGERQRLALARALYSNPKILLLDEPSNGLDKNSQAKLISSIKKIKGKMIIIIVSHNKEVSNICDRILKLDKNGLKKI